MVNAPVGAWNDYDDEIQGHQGATGFLVHPCIHILCRSSDREQYMK
ncbi:MAG: hypothetical protein LUE14_07585 [Clostridiales bacterium]|nr:hypothetical protein [Clostridiales bacterium]MCD8109946.1 hypothetical protein [Clostridiales bacterium]MCD8132934.1 hypothetical protein [Clostridiales bacterium]